MWKKKNKKEERKIISTKTGCQSGMLFIQSTQVEYHIPYVCLCVCVCGVVSEKKTHHVGRQSLWLLWSRQIRQIFIFAAYFMGKFILLTNEHCSEEQNNEHCIFTSSVRCGCGFFAFMIIDYSINKTYELTHC